jgi:hypothetical protein
LVVRLNWTRSQVKTGTLFTCVGLSHAVINCASAFNIVLFLFGLVGLIM